MWLTLNCFKKSQKIKKLAIYRKNKKVYLLVWPARGKPRLAVSKNGLDFDQANIGKNDLRHFSQNKKRKALEQHIYRSALAPGSEWMTQSDLAVERAISTSQGVLIFYHYQKQNTIEVGVLMTDTADSKKIIWRHNCPVWTSPDEWKNQELIFVDLIKTPKRYLAYWWLKGKGLFVIAYPKYRINNQIKIRQTHHLHKIANNPIISPNAENSWEAFTTFNPAAIYEAGKVHILYRAQGFDYVSVLGYANSKNGTHIYQQGSKPAYVPIRAFEKKKPGQAVNLEYTRSGGGHEGCEDPRVTRIGDRIYMTYVAFNGWEPQRITLTSIKLSDFLAQRWLWEKPILISPPGAIDKSACLLPEKINGKYVIFHRIFPNILIDFVDDLEFGPGNYLKGEYKIGPRSPMWWDSRKVGVGAPPLKTKDGWLLIYQSVDDKDASHYLVGAMLLDLNDPTKVLHRSSHPIVEPDQWYDNEGFKAGVVYPCGAVIIKGRLFVYYGGADSYVCVATADLDQFLDKLKNNQKNKLESTYLRQSK